MACPVTTPSPYNALESLGVRASAPISKKVPGSTSAWTRARALGMPFLSRLATAFSPPGSLASSRRACSSASFSAVVCWVGAGPEAGNVSATTCLPHSSGLFCLDLVERLGHVRAYLRDDRLVDGLDVLATDRHDLEVGHMLTPAAVRLANGIPRLEHDRVVMV